MKKYFEPQLDIKYLHIQDVLTGSSEFCEDSNDNDVSNDGFKPFYS